MPKLYDVFHEMHETVFEYQVVAAAVKRYQAGRSGGERAPAQWHAAAPPRRGRRRVGRDLPDSALGGVRDGLEVLARQMPNLISADCPEFPGFSPPKSAPKPSFWAHAGIPAYAETRFSAEIMGISGPQPFGNRHQSS
jgi:hypothetical protein